VRRRSVQAFVGLSLSALCVALSVWAIDWTQALKELGRVHAGWACLGVLALCASFAAYAMRWRELLGDLPQPPFPQAFGYLMIGYMVNAVLPMRPGDVLRAALIGSRYDVTLSGALSSIVLERLIDILTVVLIGSLIAIFVAWPRPVEVALWVFGGAGIAAAAIIIALSLRPALIGAFTEKLGEKARRWIQPFLNGLAVLRPAGRLRRALLWNLLAWCNYALYMGFILLAVDVPAPPVAAGLVVVVGVSLSAAIPSSPGAIGIYHAIVILALTIWNVPTSTALAFALISHAGAIALHISLGAASASAMGINNVLLLARAGDNAASVRMS